MTRFVVLGAGLQGRAAAHDLLARGEPAEVLLADVSPDALADARAFLEASVPPHRAAALRTESLDAGDPLAVAALLAAPAAGDADAAAARPRGVVLSCVPYFFNLELARVAIAHRHHFLDLGGATDIVLRELALDGEARAQGIGLVPDCGLGPGMISTVAVAAMEGFERVDEVRIYDGGLPQQPTPPLHYTLLFSVHGLLNEYFHPGVALRDGRRVAVDGLSEVEVIEGPPELGRLEAAHAAGGLSTLPYTYEGRVGTLFNKLLRYPGHIALMRALRDMGFLDEKPINWPDGGRVSPWTMSAEVLRRHLERPGDRDWVFLRVVVRGRRDGAAAETICELLEAFDPSTGMTAMMRTTGFPAAIVARMLARGEIPAGAHPVEIGVPPAAFLREAAARGFRFAWRRTAGG